MKKIISLLCLTLCSCSQSYLVEPSLKVDISEQRLYVNHPKAQFSTPISTAKRGIGGKPGSNKTPLGKLVVQNHKIGRYGPTVELHGRSIDGYEQRGRYIQIHKGCIKSGSRGCVRTSASVSNWIYRNVAAGTPIEIEM